MSRSALYVLAATLGVVVFGAIVRINGSGAGCGQHWPTCHGEIIHLPRTVHTLIELTHRVTSGLSALAVFWLGLQTRRCFEPGHRVRRAAFWAASMMVVEALLGAGLVLFGLVAGDRSAARAVVMPLHLLSTSALTAALILVVWWSRPRHVQAPPADRRIGKQAALGLVLVLLVSATGALTALGDTLYPVRAAELGSRWAADQATNAHFLERLRVLHPVTAVVVGLVLIGLARRATSTLRSRAGVRFARALLALTLVQLAVGALNVKLSAPGYLQVTHLFVACSVWIALVLLWTEASDPRDRLRADEQVTDALPAVRGELARPRSNAP